MTDPQTKTKTKTKTSDEAIVDNEGRFTVGKPIETGQVPSVGESPRTLAEVEKAIHAMRTRVNSQRWTPQDACARLSLRMSEFLLEQVRAAARDGWRLGHRYGTEAMVQPRGGVSGGMVDSYCEFRRKYGEPEG